MQTLGMMITGHRPDKLGGYTIPNPLLDRIEISLTNLLKTLSIAGARIHGITGMAQGVDQVFARACQNADIPYEAFVPFPGQERIWPPMAQARYRALLEPATAVRVITPQATTRDEVVRALRDRNTAMVQAAAAAIAIWDGSRSGTADAVKKLRTTEKPLLILNPRNLPALSAPEVQNWTNDVAKLHDCL